MPKGVRKTRTFSIDSELIDSLEKEAANREISTSELMNQMILRSSKLTWPAEKTGAIIIARDIIQDLIEHYSEEELRKIATKAAQRHKNTLIVVYGIKQNLESVLDLVKNLLGNYARWFKFTHNVNGRNNKILLNHEIGLKWSCFIDAYMQSFFLEMLDIPVKSSYTSNTIILEFAS